MDKNISTNINITFGKIKEIRLKIKNKITKIENIKSEIKKNYIKYINTEKKDFFGLDSFHFQNKVLELEYDNMLKLYHFIDNRIYGDYYKLFIMIEKFLKKNLTVKQIEKIKELNPKNPYPIYKDLEPFKLYDFDTINNIHQDIIIIISNVKEIYKENEELIKQHMKELNLGMNIDNYIINHEYINHNLNSTNNLHENYLHVYHKYHCELLNKYYDKINLFYRQIEHHIISDNSNLSDNSPSPKYIKELDDVIFEQNIIIDISENIVEDISENIIKDISENIVEDISENEFIVVKKKKRNRKKK